MGYRKEMLMEFLLMVMPTDCQMDFHLGFQMVIKKVCLLKVTLKANLTVLLMGFRSENQKDFLMVIQMGFRSENQKDFLMVIQMAIQTVN